MRPNTPSDIEPKPLRLSGGGTASITDEGSGPPVVCVHGLPGSARDFRWLAPAFTALGQRVLRVELPGLGQSESDVPPPELHRHLSEVIETLGLAEPLVLGHSFGSTVTARLAADYPERVGRLAVIAGIGLRRHRYFRRYGWLPYFGLLAESPLGGNLALRLMQAGLQATGFRHDVDDRSVRRVMAILRAFSFEDHREALRRLSTPTAIVWCDNDPLIEPDIPLELSAFLPPGPRLRFETGEHSPQKHHANEIAEALVGWRPALPTPAAPAEAS